MAKIDHAAIRTASYEEAQKFFEDIFEMHMWREIGEKPERKCWYKEGIQLCETEEIETSNENGYDHISIAVDEAKESVLEKAKKAVEGKITGNIIKEIYVPGKIVNIVAK